MVAQRLQDMTIDDLKTLIRTEIDLRLREGVSLSGARSVKEVNESIRQHRWTPPEGTPSNLELLREDRDQ